MKRHKIEKKIDHAIFFVVIAFGLLSPYDDKVISTFFFHLLAMQAISFNFIPGKKTTNPFQ